jgi:hypothetical protein
LTSLAVLNATEGVPQQARPSLGGKLMSERNARFKWRLGAGLSAMILFVGVVLATAAIAGPIGDAQGFQDDDGNLIDDGDGIDWNSFDPVNWLPSPSATPTREADKTALGFKFKGIEDWANTTADSGFAGGTKQDQNCPAVISAKAPNKDDLERIYLASTLVGGHTFLNLAWTRIPQNTTSPSAHVAFEFNKGETACGGNADGLKSRVAGDMLIVYDFEGGATDVPVITVRRWVTSGACEVGSSTAPCWGPATNLTAAGFAEAKVNTAAGVLDSLTPPALTSTDGESVNSTSGINEFGEAGIDLTAAGVFPSGTCVSFGTASAVSRTSGNSGTAQMKDLVGPGDFRLSNCGSITIIKHTDPRGLNQNFGYTTTGGLTPSTFTLNDNGNSGGGDSTGNTRTYTDVTAGTYTVTEGADPSGFKFKSLVCVDSGGNSSSVPAGSKTATITVVGDGSTTCTYVNEQQLGAIKISKTSIKSGKALSGAQFSITGPNNYSNSVTTGSNGTVCVDGLAFGAYTVTETAAPTGYSIDDTSGHSVTVDNNAKCSDDPYVGETTSFTDTPLADIQVRFRDGGSGETTLAQALSCTGANGTSSTGATTGWDNTLTISGNKVGATDLTITCTIVIDP